MRKNPKIIHFTFPLIAAVWLCVIAQPGALAQEQPPAPRQDPLLAQLAYLTGVLWDQTYRLPTALPQADQTLSLEDCLRIARENSGAVLIANEKLKSAKWIYQEKKRDVLPAFSVKFNLKEGLDTNKETFKGLGYRLVGDHAVYDGNAKFMQLEKAVIEYDQAKVKRREAINEAGYSVRQAYYRLLQAALLRRAQGSYLAQVSDIATRAAKLAENNLLKPVERTAITVQLRDAQTQLRVNEQEFLLAQLAMKQALNVYHPEPMKLDPNLPLAEPQITMDQCLRLAFLHRTEFVLDDLERKAARLQREIDIAANGMQVTMEAEVGHRGEALNRAIEGIQTRIDGTMGIKVSMPFGPNVLKYEPNFAKEVKDVGESAPTDYNEHESKIELFENASEQDNLDAAITFQESYSEWEKTSHDTANQVGNRLMTLQQARTQLGLAQSNVSVAQERLRVMLAQAGQAGGAALPQELGLKAAANGAAQAAVRARFAMFHQYNELNKTLGLDGYWDPHAGKATEPIEPLRVAGQRRWFEFWRDTMLEADKDILESPSLEEGLKDKAHGVAWGELIAAGAKD